MSKSISVGIITVNEHNARLHTIDFKQDQLHVDHLVYPSFLGTITKTYDVIVLDSKSGGQMTSHLLQLLQNKFTSAKVAIVYNEMDRQQAQTYIQVGVSGILHHDDLANFVQIMRTITAGHVVISQKIIQTLLADTRSSA